jgi:lycopene cyclase domain-containing protein
MSLYTLLLFGSFIVPLVLSFDKKLQFYKQWKYLFPALIIVAFFYIVFDVFFTNKGFWGFNPSYHSSIEFFHLPIEEWLFFIIIPYASIFLHDSIVCYFPRFRLSDRQTKYLSIFLLVVSLFLLILYLNQAYTSYMLALVILSLVWSLFDKSKLISNFYLTFLVLLIPFSIVNGVLTGSFIAEPVVWYDENQIIGIRVFTIPIEDFGYWFSLILFALLVRNQLKSIFHAK